MWQRTGKRPKQLEEAAELPEFGAHVWQWFVQLNNLRGNNGMAPEGITARQIKDWSWATGNEPVLWERRALLAIDAAWMKEVTK